MELKKARYTAVIMGTVTEENERFFYNGLYFVLKTDESGWYFEAEETGTEYNNIFPEQRRFPLILYRDLKEQNSVR